MEVQWTWYSSQPADLVRELIHLSVWLPGPDDWKYLRWCRFDSCQIAAQADNLCWTGNSACLTYEAMRHPAIVRRGPRRHQAPIFLAHKKKNGLRSPHLLQSWSAAVLDPAGDQKNLLLLSHKALRNGRQAKSGSQHSHKEFQVVFAIWKNLSTGTFDAFEA